jgi:type IV pilus assembly protein PilM
MAKGRIGLDVGSTAVRAVELSTGGSPSVLRAAQVALPAGAVENGEVRDPDRVGEALRELWQSGGFKGRQVYMGVGNQRVVVREIAIPWLPEKELRASLGFQVQEFIPMATDEAVLDFDPLGEFEHEDRRMLRMLLVAAQRAMVDGLIRAAQVAKLEPLGLDLVPFALVRSVGSGDAGMDLEEEGEEAVIDIGAHVTNIVVHERGRTKFVRILPSGGRDVTMAIGRAAGVEDEIAERLKRGEDVELPDDDGYDDDDEAERPSLPSAADVRAVALSRAGAFVDEIRSSLEFYTAQSREARIGHVLVTGGGSKLEGLLELMRQRIPVPVDPGRVFDNVGSQLHMPPEVQADAEPGLAVAVGLAIPGRDK